MEPALRKDVVRSGNEVSVMAGSVNKVMLIGNLGKDPEVRRLNSGDPVVSLRIATSESWRDKTTGERKERPEWHDQQGNKRRSTEVVLQRFRGELTLLDSRGGGPGAMGEEASEGGAAQFGRSSPMERRPAPAPAGGGGGKYAGELDDDIPF